MNVCQTAPKMLWICYLVGVSHFALCHDNQLVIVWKMLRNLIKSPILQWWGKWKSDLESIHGSDKITDTMANTTDRISSDLVEIIMAAEEKHCDLRKPLIRLPWGTPQAIATKMRDIVSRADLHPCAKFQPNPFSCFAGNASQTDEQTDTHTNSKLNIPHYHGRYNNFLIIYIIKWLTWLLGCIV